MSCYNYSLIIGGGCIAIAGDGGLRQWQVSNHICHLAHVPDSFFAIRCTNSHSYQSPHFLAIHTLCIGLMMEMLVKQLYCSLLHCMMTQALFQLAISLIMVSKL